MKIAFIVSEFPALSETFILNQIVGLIELGYEVDIYSTMRRDDPKVHPDVEKYHLLSRTYYAAQMPASRIARYLKAVKLFATNFLKAPRVMLQTLNFFKYGRQLGQFTLLYEVIPWLRRGKSYDVLLCHFGWNGLKAAGLKDIGAIGGKIITAFHGITDTRVYSLGADDRLYDNLFAKKLDLALPITKLWEERLLELGCDRQKMLVHRMGIDCQTFPFSLRVPHQSNLIRILTIGRLVEKKGIEYGIRAVANLVPLFPNIRYQIVGDGFLRPQLEELIKELNVVSQVQLLGWKQQAEVKEILDNSDIFLVPSVTGEDGDQEGLPVVLMEAMAMGLPILSTLHSSIPELVEDGISGFLVPERDVDSLTQKLQRLIEDPQLWQEMGKAGHTFVQTHHNIDKLNEQLVEIFEQVLIPRRATVYIASDTPPLARKTALHSDR